MGGTFYAAPCTLYCGRVANWPSLKTCRTVKRVYLKLVSCYAHFVHAVYDYRAVVWNKEQLRWQLLWCIATRDRSTWRYAVVPRPKMHHHTHSTLPQGIFRQSKSTDQCFWPNLYRACSETANEEFPIKLLISPIDYISDSKKREW